MPGNVRGEAGWNRRCLFGIGLAGIAARVWLWWFSVGSNDAAIWYGHAQHVLVEGLVNTYRNYQTFPQFNHPPLMGLYAASARLWTGDNLWNFARLIKLPGLAGEALTLWALWRFASPRAFANYACLPAAILVSSFHGNTDCLYAALVLVAAIAFDKERYFLSGILWSAALNVKLLPLALVPLVLLGAPNRRAFGRVAAGFSLGLVPFLPPALVAGKAMYQNLVAYNSFPDNWGIMALLAGGASTKACASVCGSLKEWWPVAGRYAVLLATAGVALFSRFRHRIPMSEQAALGATLFFLLTPGFAVQYIVLAAPLLCLVDPAVGALWGWTSGIFASAVYGMFAVSWMPIESRVMVWYPWPAKVLGMLAWTALACFAWSRLSRAWRPGASLPFSGAV